MDTTDFASKRATTAEDASAAERRTVTVHAGMGASARDWAKDVASMLLAWAARRGWRIHSVSVGPNGESVSMVIEGAGASALDACRGVHRLVRVSPHDPQRRRCTDFAAVDVHGHAALSVPAHVSQVRSYVMDPYTMAKDHMTGRETPEVKRVLAGELDLLS